MTEAAENAIQPLSWQVLDVLVGKARDLVGEAGLNVLETLKTADRTKAPDPRIVYNLGNDLEDTFGKKGAFAILRQVGREIGQMFTNDKDAETATEIMQSTLRQLGFAYEIKFDGDDAYICQCVFYKLLAADGHGPIERPVCWTGWGFIEGCMKNVNGAHHVQWEERDNEAKACRFSIRQTADHADLIAD